MALPDKDAQAAIAVTRFGLGARPGELEKAKADPRGWLKEQITASGAEQPNPPLPGSAERISAYREYQQDRRAQQQMRAEMESQSQDPQAVQLARLVQAGGLQEELVGKARIAANTQAPFRERWALFFANHFTVSATKGQVVPAVGPFEREAIRPHVFGKFGTMLAASSSHPGMLIYLDQVQSVGPGSLAAQRRRRDAGLNENLAREILELHTVGVGGGYSQADVTEFARAMTGFSVGGPQDGPAQAGKFVFRRQAHEPGPRTIMGKRYADEGSGTVLAILNDLTAHPATAKHLARKIACHFVADNPPPALVAKLESAFTGSGGQLDAVARTLIDADEAWEAAPAKFKTPYELVISGHRALGVAPMRPQQIAQPLNTLGQPAFRAPSPKGWPEEAAAWAAPDAIVKRLAWSEDFAAQVSNGPRPPLQVAKDALGSRLRPETASAIIGAESRTEALTILFMSPEFQRR